MFPRNGKSMVFLIKCPVSIWEHFCHAFKPNCALSLTHIVISSQPNLIVPGLSSVMRLYDDMVLWSIRGIPACHIYGPACLLALLTTPTPFNLTAVIHCHCLMTMALANCQLTHRLRVSVCVHLRVWAWDCWDSTSLCSTVECSMSVKCRAEVTSGKKQGCSVMTLVTIQTHIPLSSKK